jgi:hypothetical protein
LAVEATMAVTMARGKAIEVPLMLKVSTRVCDELVRFRT